MCSAIFMTGNWTVKIEVPVTVQMTDWINYGLTIFVFNIFVGKTIEIR